MDRPAGYPSTIVNKVHGYAVLENNGKALCSCADRTKILNACVVYFAFLCGLFYVCLQTSGQLLNSRHQQRKQFISNVTKWPKLILDHFYSFYDFI